MNPSLPEFIAELPRKPTAMTTWRGITFVCTEGPAYAIQRNAEGGYTVTSLEPESMGQSVRLGQLGFSTPAK